jgi:hypothetical protein
VCTVPAAHGGGTISHSAPRKTSQFHPEQHVTGNTAPEGLKHWAPRGSSRAPAHGPTPPSVNGEHAPARAAGRSGRFGHARKLTLSQPQKSATAAQSVMD